ncbi:flagellar hook-associated protein 2 [Keratinibaculum paraultunense]|uniref:Flagellar hook-associated protein 2 n=1 Tax=Keratinibaculum paraultunense TaxID=1278232 RepID=A0A4R3L0R5_9FIRM|nr:flagellar filament capping protein FliD [Keratinibaculum paraultunense]QQY80081.1 flagellar filament capping protein FliD [Keratinibaculum paraultunense]TCS91598.1 flagellar hook-associated protein 2 [Keratinibaculum paraultunense]
MYNTMRIDGLASGIDTEEIIKNLMRAERVKVDRVEQEKQIVLWRQEMYNDLNKDFANFIINTRKMFGLTSVTHTGTLVPNSYKSLNWVKKATSSNENIAKVSTTAMAVDGNYKVKVDKLAEGVNLASGVDIRKSENNPGLVGENGKIVDEDGNIIKNIEFTINDGKNDFKIKISKDEGITMNDVVRAINSAKKTIDGEEVSIEAKASYDANIGRFFLQTTNTGADAKIKIDTEDDITKYFINGLKLTNGEKDESNELKFYTVGEELAGQDAVINFNGAQNIKSSTNRITINGITMDLINTGEFNINVSADVDAIYEKIEQFVEEYNKLIEKANQLLAEKRYRDYKPLTAEQKKEMDKEDIKLWEEKAKSGLLRSDDLISRTMLNVRRSLYEKSAGIEGSYQLITEIGISTEKYARGSAGGKLVIDEQKLKEAIAKDSEGVIELLFKESNPEHKEVIDGKEVVQTGGIVTRVYENLMAGMEEIIKKSGTGENAELYRGVKPNILLEFVSKHGSISLLDEDLIQYNKKIDDLNEMLFRKENYYYKKFTAMEKAISRMNSQSMWMMQQFMNQ